MQALLKSRAQASFASVKLLTDDTDTPLPHGIQRVKIDRIDSSASYSRFVLKKLADFVEADHALIVQWDGYVLNGHAWTDQFLAYDYIGARWNHFGDKHVVGNGGFSLRSRRLLRACQDRRITLEGAEDVTIARKFRILLEQEFGIRFAPSDIADAFSYERLPPQRTPFGFHGVFNMIGILGPSGFADLYAQLDKEALGPRELRDCFVRIARRAPFGQQHLAVQLLRDWWRARRRKRSLA